MSYEYVGILVGKAIYRGLPIGKTKHEKCAFYEIVAREFQLKPCYFRLQDIRVSRGFVRAYVHNGQRFVLRNLPLPRVIHNRCIYTKASSLRKLARLAERVVIFNGGNRYSKLLIHELLMKDEEIRPHLPGTLPYSDWALEKWMTHYNEIIMKPDNSSVGKGVYKLSKQDDNWEFLVQGRSYPFETIKQRCTQKKYIIQQKLPLATFEGRPFDLRVSIQKSKQGLWQLTGIVGKVAAPGKYVTNVAQGGTVYRLESLLQVMPQLDPIQVRASIRQFCLRVAMQLDRHLPHAADFGMDIGLTVHGFPVFIECNGRDLRYSFKLAGMLEEWKATYRNPISYARYLIDDLTHKLKK